MAKKTNQTKPGRTEYHVTPEAFITAWQTSETAGEVAARLGMPKPIVLARASSYRKDGIKLKKMRRESKRALDVDSLNRLIEDIGAAHGGPTKGHNRVGRQVKDLLKGKG